MALGIWSRERIVKGQKEGGTTYHAHHDILPQPFTSDPSINLLAPTLHSTHTHPSMRVGYMDPKDVWLSYWKDEHKWKKLWMCAACPPNTALRQHICPPKDPLMFPHRLPFQADTLTLA